LGCFERIEGDENADDDIEGHAASFTPEKTNDPDLPRHLVECRLVLVEKPQWAGEVETSVQYFDNFEACFAEPLAWAGPPHSAVVWDYVNGAAYDPNGQATKRAENDD
jgi:hypothetical protein